MGLKAMCSAKHELKPWKPQVKINLSFFNLLSLDIITGMKSWLSQVHFWPGNLVVKCQILLEWLYPFVVFWKTTTKTSQVSSVVVMAVTDQDGCSHTELSEPLPMTLGIYLIMM